MINNAWSQWVMQSAGFPEIPQITSQSFPFGICVIHGALILPLYSSILLNQRVIACLETNQFVRSCTTWHELTKVVARLIQTQAKMSCHNATIWRYKLHSTARPTFPLGPPENGKKWMGKSSFTQSILSLIFEYALIYPVVDKPGCATNGHFCMVQPLQVMDFQLPG